MVISLPSGKTPVFFEHFPDLDDLPVYEFSKLAGLPVYVFQNSKFVLFCQFPFAIFVHPQVGEFALHQPALWPLLAPFTVGETRCLHSRTARRRIGSWLRAESCVLFPAPRLQPC